jgi:hypothetical protein
MVYGYKVVTHEVNGQVEVREGGHCAVRCTECKSSMALPDGGLFAWRNQGRNRGIHEGVVGRSMSDAEKTWRD